MRPMYQQPLPTFEECLKLTSDVRQTLTAFRIEIISKKEQWLECKRDGKIIYINSKTRDIRDTKPDAFKTREELMLDACVWKEVKEDGTCYYVNKKTSERVTEMPKEYANIINRISSLKNNAPARPVERPVPTKPEKKVITKEDILCRFNELV